MLCHNIHGYLAKIQVCAYASGGSDTRFVKDITYHLHGKLSGGHMVGSQIIGHVHENLVNGVNVYVLGGDVFQIYLVYPCASYNAPFWAER